ncbi:MAG: PRC-barrel domain-containing protein [Candidatus Micrarchaeia archaeon]
MTIRLSKLYGMDIFSDNGKYLGKVYDLILDLEKGEIVRMTLESIHAASREEALRIIRERTILYKNVKSVEDVIIVGRPGPKGYEYEAPTEEKYSFLK